MGICRDKHLDTNQNNSNYLDKTQQINNSYSKIRFHWLSHFKGTEQQARSQSSKLDIENSLEMTMN